MYRIIKFHRFNVFLLRFSCILLSFHNTHFIFIFMFSLQIPIFSSLIASLSLSLWLLQFRSHFWPCEFEVFNRGRKCYQVIGLNEGRQPELMTIQKLQISVLTLEWLQTVSGFFFSSLFLNVFFCFSVSILFRMCGSWVRKKNHLQQEKNIKRISHSQAGKQNVARYCYVWQWW